MGLKRKWNDFMNNEALKHKIYMIIYDTDTPMGKLFDVCLIGFILVSVLVVILESLAVFPPHFKVFLNVLEWIFTIFFTVEYLLRIYSSPKPREYVFSFFGAVDLFSTLPTYLGFFFPTAHGLLTIRILRLIRVFRVFKLFSYWREGEILLNTLKSSFRKITVFFVFVLLMVICIGTVMYMVEGGIEGSSFNDIPSSIYWAIVTTTTVGYGDITPMTPLGRFLSAFVMLLGYTVLAVPTGIVSAQMITQKKKISMRPCPHCHKTGHDEDAVFCRYCGKRLYDDETDGFDEEEIITQEGEIK